MRLDLEVFGEQIVRRDLVRLGERASDMGPALRQVASQLRRAELERFDRQGPGWARLQEETLRAKVRKGLDPRILRATERMRNSLIGRGSEHIEEITPVSLRFGTAVPYARFHQTGTSTMPQRRVVELAEPQKRAIVKTVQRWIVTGHV